MPNNHLDFGVDLLPVTTDTYNLGTPEKKWNIYGTLKSDNIVPISSKTYSAYTCSADNQAKAVLFFGKINITDTSKWQAPWSIHYRIYVEGADANSQGWYDCHFSVSGSTVNYYNYNNFYSTDWRPIYHHSLIYPKNGYSTYGGYFGVRVQSSKNVTTAARTFKIEILETVGCTITLNPSIKRYDEVYITTNNIANTTIWYYTEFNGTSLGLQESGDTNTNDTAAGYIRDAGSSQATIKVATILYPYLIMLPSGDGLTYNPINTTNKSTATTKTNIYSGSFNITQDIYYYPTDASVSANSSVRQDRLWLMYALNLRYSFNIGDTLTVGKEVYMVASLDSLTTASLRNPTAIDNNASAQATGENAGPITQILPTTEDGYIYIYLGRAYTANTITLSMKHPIYWYKNGHIALYNGSFAASTDTISILRDTATSIATINGTEVKIKIPASDNTWRPIGTGANDAMAGNTVVTNVTQSASTTGSWRKVLLAGGDAQASWNSSVVGKTEQAYQAVGIAVQPSTGTLRASILQGGSLILSEKTLQFAGTKATTTILECLDNTADANGNGIKIGGGGVTVIGSGEAAGNFSPVSAGTETLYLLSDNQIYLETNAQTIANRVGFYISNSNELIPIKAETATNNYGSIGTSTYKWANVYATTFTGNLTGDITGNAATITATQATGDLARPIWFSFQENNTVVNGKLGYNDNFTYNPKTGLLQTGDDITGAIWCGTATANTAGTGERDVGVKNGSGRLYLYATAATNGNKGLYSYATNQSTGGAILTVNQSNQISAIATLACSPTITGTLNLTNTNAGQIKMTRSAGPCWIWSNANVIAFCANYSTEIDSSKSALRINTDTVDGYTNNYAHLGSSSVQWKDVHSYKYMVEEKVTLQWNSTDSSLDFVFA